MSLPDCKKPLAVANLLEYWLGELSEADEGQIEEHLMACGLCSASLQSIIDIGTGIDRLVRRGAFRALLTRTALDKLRSEGLRVREYRVPLNGSVQCTVTADDDVLVARLEAPFSGSERMDLVEMGPHGQVRERWKDIPFEASGGEIVLLSRMDEVRLLPASTLVLRLLAVSDAGERMLGEYTFNHTPSGTTS